MDDLKNSLQRARARIEPPEPALDRLVDRRNHRKRNRQITSIAMAFVVMAVGVAAVALALGSSGPEKHGQGGVADDGEHNLVAGPGQYYYSRTDLYFGPALTNESGLRGPWKLTIWFAPDASGRSTFAGPTDTSENGSDTFGWRGGPDQSYGPGKFPLEDLSSLPSDPDELRNRLVQRSSEGGASPNPIATSSPGRSPADSALLRTFQDLFNGDEQFTPPEVRAAMFEVAAGITGVETLQTTDPVGRPAIGLRWAIQYSDSPSYVEWFFDPDTHQLMAESWTHGDEIYEGRVITEAGISDSTESPPASGDQFFPRAERSPSFVP